jgi:hypothetical protein
LDSAAYNHLVRKPGGGDNDPRPKAQEASPVLSWSKAGGQRRNLNARMTKNVSVGLTSLNTQGATPFFWLPELRMPS